jgi:uncharacterized membrane protein YfcA
MPTAADLLIAGAAGFAAGGINAVAGGGTLVSFPALVALGVPAISANVTNTVALVPGYFGGAYAQRRDLADFATHLRSLLVVAGVGGLIGSVLLVLSPESFFRGIVPWLILLACGLLASGEAVKRWLARRRAAQGRAHRPVGPVPLHLAVLGAAVYGGYFGAGLGIMLLAVLGLALDDPLPRVNALKQALSFVINVLAASFFVFSGKVVWTYAAVMAVTSLLGGNVGGRLVDRLRPTVLRAVVVVFGTLVALRMLLV